jgi:hypothetical protein
MAGQKLKNILAEFSIQQVFVFMVLFPDRINAIHQ